MLGMAEGAPAGRAGVSQGPEWAKPVLSRHGTHSHAAREPQVERLSRASWGCCHLSPEVSPLRLISPILGHVPVTFPTLICRNPTRSQTTCWAKPYVVTTSRHTASIRMATVTRKATDCIAMCQAQS